ncbi:6,7-dimethyl-8-ribityllumazine synthase [Candidatus Peregrinibacteria bacterium]|nr:6,7-dimethyl-8-ribityllumazine synthase [Candidatus Peregrinibacteria bacterium]
MQIAIIASQFNKKICDRLITGSKKALDKAGLKYEIFAVPGAFEIPFMAQKLIDSKKFAGIIALGCVIKGETDHYKAVCEGVTYGIQKVSIENRIPIMFGVLMCHDISNAFERSAENSKHNKGYECANGLIEILQRSPQK